MKYLKFNIAILFFFLPISLFSQIDDDWAKLVNYYEIEGTWVGYAVSEIKNSNSNEEFISKITISLTFNYKNGEKMVYSIVKIDLNDYLNDLENLNEMKENSYTKEILWINFIEIFKTYNIFIFENYCMFYDNSDLAENYFASDSRGEFFINETKDLLLLIYFESAFELGLGDSGFTEMQFKRIN